MCYGRNAVSDRVRRCVSDTSVCLSAFFCQLRKDCLVAGKLTVHIHFSFNQIQELEIGRINKDGEAYQVYDDVALLSGDDLNDKWQAYNYKGGGNKVTISGFALNGSYSLRIAYAAEDMDIEVTSFFDDCIFLNAAVLDCIPYLTGIFIFL